MSRPFRYWLLPRQMRFLSGTRALSITLRTVHLAAFGLLLGGHAFSVEPERLLPYLFLTVLSGVGLILLEVYAVGLYWLFLGKGLMVLLKLGIIVLIPFFWEARVALLLLVVAIASVGSHMRARFRHYSVLHRRVIQPGEPLTPALLSLAPHNPAPVRVGEGRSPRER